MNQIYAVQLEVAGPFAMFARPDTGGTPTSFPVPTWSASKGIFESIAFLSDGRAWINPRVVEVCRRIGEPGGRIRFQRYTTNYGGPLRKSSLFGKGTASGGSSMQLFATIVSDVCYRLQGIVVGTEPSGRTNARHYLKDLFERRLKQGRCFRTPCLGWSEFTCSYWGPFRNGVTEVDDALTLDVPSMLVAVWDRPITPPGEPARYAPRFTQGQPDSDGNLIESLKIKHGVLRYDVPSVLPNGPNPQRTSDAQ